MPNNTHAVAPEDVMAYLDGELPVEEASRIAAHLGQCSDCQHLAASLKDLSITLRSWEADAPGHQSHALDRAFDQRNTVSKTLVAAVREPRASRWSLFTSHPWLWGGSALSLATLLLAVLLSSKSTPDPNRSVIRPELLASLSSEPSNARQNDFNRTQAEILKQRDPTDWESGSGGQELRAIKPEISTVANRSNLESAAPPPNPPPAPLAAQTASPAPSPQTGSATTPMIVRTAVLAITTADFDHARPRLDEIIRQHQGYLGDLNANSVAGNSRTLTATLRIPASQMDATISALKPLGHVDSESQNGEEVTTQYADIQARIQNYRNTETRLTDLLRKNTGRLSEVLEVETEITRVRGYIEEQEGEKKIFEKHVSFATINLTINEEFKAHPQVVPNTTGTRIRNAAIGGYQDAASSLIAILLFIVSSAPTLLLWAAILFFPIRIAWKKWKPSQTTSQEKP